MEKSCSQNEDLNGLSTVRLVCPSCFKRFDFPETKVKGQMPLCPYCGVPLVKDRLGGQTPKTVSPGSPWCRKIKDQIDAELARTRQEFARVEKKEQQSRNSKKSKH